MTKKLMMLVAALAAAFGARADTWTDPDTGYTWTYRINSDTAEIYATYNNSSYSYTPAISPSPTGAVTIPSTLGCKPVTSIGSGAFYDCSGLTIVTIPDSVTSIGDRAFHGCSGLTSVTIPDGVKNIGNGVFYDCSGLTDMIIPASVTNLDVQAFSRCNGLTSICIPKSVASVRYYAFEYCTSLTNVTLSSGVVNVEEGAFFGCSGLESFVVANDNPSYKSHEGLLLTKDGTLLVCGVNGDVVIPDGVTRIAASAFRNCRSLTSVKIPNGMTSIGSDAFWYCENLSDIEIPDSVTHIEGDAFEGCNVLLFDVATIPGVKLVDGWVVGYESSFSGAVTLDNIRGIGEWAFSGCSGLTDVILPENLNRIGTYAFNGCYNLEHVQIPDGVVSIGDSAFNGCCKLSSVLLPESVTYIGERAFNCCESLTDARIPYGVRSIGDMAFHGCSGLTNIVFEGNAPSVGSSTFYGVKSGCVAYVHRGSTGWGVGVPGTWNGLRIEYIEGPDVALGTWTSDFALAKEYADKNSIPMLVYWTNPGCSYCERLEKDVFKSEQFAEWCQERQFVMVYSQGDATVKQFARNSSGAYPFVAVYWEKGNGEDTLLVKFTGRNGMMPWRWGTLTEQFINSVDSVLGNKEIPAYIVDDGVLIYVNPSLTEFEIPADVVEIGYKAFDGCTSLTNVVIPVGVNQIGSSAFRGCIGLTSVTIPDSVTSIGDFAFEDCNGLTSVTIPDSVKSIGDYAFYNCSGLAYVKLGSGVISIGEEAFSGCVDVQDFIVDASNRSYKSLNGFLLTADGTSILFVPEGRSEVIIPDSVTSIGYEAFSGCSGLTSVTIPDSVTSIGDEAFCNCNGLTNVVIGSGVTSIGSYAFSGCSGLTGVTIPDSVTSIGDFAFEDCNGLTSVIIGNGVTSIGDYTFSGCSGLTSVTIGSGVTSIGEGVFSGCSDSLYDTMTIPGVMLVDGWAIDHTDSLSGNLDLIGVRGVGPYAFAGCSGLTSVKIPDSVTSIGYDAFSGCSDSLYDTMTIPGVMLVDGWAVGHTDSLSGKLDLTGVRGVGPYAFSGCSGLTRVTIPDSVVSIGAGAFSECGGVQDFIVDAANRSYKSSNGFLLAADGASILYAPEGRSDIVIPDGVTRIGAYSFADRENLTSVTIPDSVTVIEDGAFRECYSLTNVVLSANLKSLGYTREGWDAVGVFEGCAGLRIIVLPDGVVNIGYGSFSGCENLASITIPDSVTSIGSYAFEGCSGLVSVTIGSGVTNIGDGAFYCWSESLASIVFEGNAPNGADDAFDSDSSCTVYVPRSSTGWGVEIPGIWNGMRIEYAEDVSPDVWTATFDANGGELAAGDSSRQVEDGTPLGELPVPSRLDYAFLGWFTAAEGGECVTAETTISADIKLYAQWRCLFDGSWTQGADGVWSSGETADDSEKPLTMIVEGAGTVTFRWKVSCEDYFVFRTQKILCDYLSFRIDEEEQALINADTDWTECSFAVAGGGRHTLAWVYVKDSEGSDGEDCAWLDEVTWTPVDAPDPLPPVASDDDVAAALTGTADANVAANVTNAAQYAAYRTWALSVTNGTTTAQMIKESDKAWLSYALGADALIGKEITSNDVRIVAFEAANADSGAMGSSVDSGAMGSSRPTFAFEVAIAGVNIGGGSVAVETLKENLKKVLGIEGATTLSPDTFSSDNIEITFDTPIDGKARFTVTPPADADNSFFMRVKVK